MHHSPITITVEKLMPWEEERQSILVMTVPPLYIAISKIEKYLPPEELECHDTLNDKPVTITYMTLSTYVNRFLEGDPFVMVQFNRTTTRTMHTGQWTISIAMHKLRVYIMSQETFLRGANMVRSLLLPPYMEGDKDLMNIASMIGYKIAFYNYIARDGRIPTTVEIATKHVNSVIFDDMIFGRYEHIDKEKYEQYITILARMSEKTFSLKRGFKRLREKTHFGYILGSVYQFHTVYGK
jgi:hypothetical protein